MEVNKVYTKSWFDWFGFSFTVLMLLPLALFIVAVVVTYYTIKFPFWILWDWWREKRRTINRDNKILKIFL